MKKTLLFVGLAAFLVGAIAAWNYWRQEEHHRLELQRLQTMIENLNACERVANVVVTERGVDSDGVVHTTLQFMEWDRDGKPLQAVTCTVAGQEVYFDALVIKFDNDCVAQGDLLRGKSLILFRRIFGSAQTPESGFPVDPVAEDGIPGVYRVKGMVSDLEKDLWKRFWYYAQHPEESAACGVRVMQIEAVGARLTQGKVYELTLEADGGLNLTPATTK